METFTKILFLCLAAINNVSGQYNYQTNFYKVPLDHFSFAVKDTFDIKFLYNDSYWDRENNGPIFVYTGNEGSIESFAENTGFMWDIAPQFGALLLFAEHRYYGASSPPDSLKFKLQSLGAIDILGYLTVEQALADYARLIYYFKEVNNATSSPVIAFGGSYGGLLTAWLRMKYPHIVQGGIAASAPFYRQDISCESHDRILTSVFAKQNDNCVPVIKKSWKGIREMGKTDKGRKWLSRQWKLCNALETPDDIDTLVNWLDSMYSLIGMANYPYPANFVEDLPANPVHKFCSYLKKTELGNSKEILKDMFQALNVYINNTGKTFCFDYSDASMYSASYSEKDDNSFDYQSCTELIDPDCDDGIHDFFEPSPWDFNNFSDICYDNHKVRPQPHLLDVIYGGNDILAASNIVFSNGLLDPWYGYGVLKNLSDSLLAYVMPDTAHHLDLRGSNPADPQSVIDAREFEKTQIGKWIAQFHTNQKKDKEAFASV